ncbi:hypothetical protein H632_c157p1 [Helicosporidium sp. ATCC 50920]|nr:hypothetical protein H632_c157p1 [Helicosporidium sp. ATCC 50920]|eukprot:KDD76624.1 hypothetical protein H632_c157p1 [Helicosporidium sp. ATCC 50920]
MVENAYEQAKELRANATPEFPVNELSMIEMLEKMTTAWRPEGEWITHFDIAQEGDELRLRDMGEPGQCNQKCKTVEKAAFECMGDSDTELASALLLQRLDLPDMTDWFCSEETWACRPPLPKVPDSRKPGEDWEKKKDADEDFDAILGSMGDAGLKGSLFSREELERHMAEIDESVGDAEDGAEEEDPSEWGSYDPVEMAQAQSMSVADEALRQIDLAERRHKGDYPLYEGDPEDDDSDDELEGSKAAGVPLAQGEGVAVEGVFEDGEAGEERGKDHADSENEDEDEDEEEDEDEDEDGDESDDDDEDDKQHPAGMTKAEEAMVEALAKKPLSEEEVEFFDKLDEENDVLVVEDVDEVDDVDDEEGLTKEELDALQTESHDQDADEEHDEL